MQPVPLQLDLPASPPSLAPFGPAVRGASSARLAPLLAQMAPTSLAHLDAVSLLNRVDTKFLLMVSQLASVLPSLAQDYLVLEIESRRLHQYRTLYFDTADFDLYRQHHAGRAVRHKVRSRAYVDTGLSFFEIKAKSSEQRTVKHRLATPDFLAELTPEARAFLGRHLPMPARSLQPTLRNDFLRVTLVGKRSAERLTLDVNIQFDCDGRTAVLPGIAIVELKQNEADGSSPVMQAMREAAIPPTSISKYCVGVGLLVADVERHAFQARLEMLDRLVRTQTAEPATPLTEIVASPA